MPPRALDLFAGCGGLSLGLRKAGFEVVAACEMDRWAAQTYAFNHPDTLLLQQDARDVPLATWRDYRGEVDLLAGGPPCQGFSVHGRRQYGEVPSLNTLPEVFLDVVEQMQPRAVLLENVAGFRTAHLRPGVPALGYVLDRLKKLRYVAEWRLIQATDFGVPSLRSRLFVIAFRLPWTGMARSPFERLRATPSRQGYGGCLDAISDLPRIDAGEGLEEPQPYGSRPLNAFQARMRISSAGASNHVAMRHSPALVARFASIRPGGSSYLLPGAGVTVYKSNNQRLVASQPSLCITANFQSNYIHPLLHRNLTAREAARLMTFPDSFVFKGKRTLMSRAFLERHGRADEAGLSQYNQIGNAVPPDLAAAVARAIRDSLPERANLAA